MTLGKLPDDVFRARLHAIIAELCAWARSMADVVSIDEHEEPGHWRLTVAPAQHGAAALEIIVHASQSIDITTGPETFENEPVTELDNLVGIAKAVGAGSMTIRSWSSTETRSPLRVDTLVHLPDGALWERHRALRADSDRAMSAGAMSHDRRWRPYRR